MCPLIADTDSIITADIQAVNNIACIQGAYHLSQWLNVMISVYSLRYALSHSPFRVYQVRAPLHEQPATWQLWSLPVPKGQILHTGCSCVPISHTIALNLKTENKKKMVMEKFENLVDLAKMFWSSHEVVFQTEKSVCEKPRSHLHITRRGVLDQVTSSLQAKIEVDIF